MPTSDLGWQYTSMARRNPLPALLIAAAVPAVFLGGCWRWTEARTAAVVQPVASEPTGGSGVVATLATPVLSVRRQPAALARQLNLDAFRSSLGPLLDLVGPGSCVSVSVDGLAVAAKNDTAPVRPASNLKVITASVALDVLGADFTFTTTVAGTVGADGTVAGDLYLIGGGDPLLSSSWWKGPSVKYPTTSPTSMETLADQVVAAGVKVVSGNILGDATRYDKEWYETSWATSVRFSEGGPISALVVNDSREAPDRSSNDPVVGAAQVLADLLRQRGVTVAGSATSGSTSSAPVIASISSAPLPAVLAEMLATSDNNTAEQVLKEIGVAAGGGGSWAQGIAVVVKHLNDWGVPMDGVVMVDGSGLSDDNRFTCAAMMAVLARHGPTDALGQGLPVGGQQGGTLSDAFGDGPLAGIIRAKTGTLDNTDGIANKPGVKALSGYVPVDGGGAIDFSLILVGETIANKTEYRPVWDKLAEVLAAYSGSAKVAELAPR